jgi:hypothetical protein
MKSLIKPMKLIVVILLGASLSKSSCGAGRIIVSAVDEISLISRKSSLLSNVSPRFFSQNSGSVRRLSGLEHKTGRRFTSHFIFSKNALHPQDAAGLAKRFLNSKSGTNISDNVLKTTLTSPIVWGGGVIALGLAIYGIDMYFPEGFIKKQKFTNKGDEKIRFHWDVPRDGYRSRKTREELEGLVSKIREEEGSKVIVLHGPTGAGKTVLSRDSVWEMRSKEPFLGHFFHSTSDKKTLKKQIIAFAYNLGMPRNETSYDRARKFIEEKLSDRGAANFILIFDDAERGDKINKFLFKGPGLRGVQIITTREEKFNGYEKDWNWSFLNIDGLASEEAVDFFLVGLSENKKKNQKINREKAEEIIKVIGDTLPFNIMDLVTQINRDEITVDELLQNHKKSKVHENVVKDRIKRKPPEVRNVLAILSNISVKEIPLELVDILRDPRGKTDSILIMEELVSSGILKSPRAEVYEIHSRYQAVSMEAYIDEMRKKQGSLGYFLTEGAEIGTLLGIGAGTLVGVGLVEATNVATLTGIVTKMAIGVGIGIVPGVVIGAGIGTAAGIGIVSARKLFPSSNDTLKRELLKTMSKNVIQGCRSEHGMQKCRGFVHHLEAIEYECEEADIDVKDMKHLIKKLKQ